jgi:hypothetical protein
MHSWQARPCSVFEIVQPFQPFTLASLVVENNNTNSSNPRITILDRMKDDIHQFTFSASIHFNQLETDFSASPVRTESKDHFVARDHRKSDEADVGGLSAKGFRFLVPAELFRANHISSDITI